MKNNWGLVVHEVGSTYAKIEMDTLIPNDRNFEEFQVLHALLSQCQPFFENGQFFRKGPEPFQE